MRRSVPNFEDLRYTIAIFRNIFDMSKKPVILRPQSVFSYVWTTEAVRPISIEDAFYIHQMVDSESLWGSVGGDQ